MEREQETLKGKQKNFNPVSQRTAKWKFPFEEQKENSACFVLQYLQNPHFLGNWDIGKLWEVPLSSLIVEDFCSSVV